MQRTSWFGGILVLALTACPAPSPVTGDGSSDGGRHDAVNADGDGDVVARDTQSTPDVAIDTAAPLEGGCATPDSDGDGHRAIACGGDDCDDTDPHRFPGNPEVCGVAMVSDHDGGTVLTRTSVEMGLDPTHDEDCDPTTYASATTHDGDNDGDRVVDSTCSNTDRSGTTNHGTDCDDLTPQTGFAGTPHATTVHPGDIHPMQPEVCNGVDDNCDGNIDEGVEETFYRDCDGDLFGDVHDTTGAMACFANQAPLCMGHEAVPDHTDCDDAHVTAHPGGIEVCDAAHVDENCNGIANEGCACLLGDHTPCCGGRGMAACVMSGGMSSFGACNALTMPEVCNGIDDDCMGGVDDGAPCPSVGESCTGGHCVCPGSQVVCPNNNSCVPAVQCTTTGSVGACYMCGAMAAYTHGTQTCNGNCTWSSCALDVSATVVSASAGLSPPWGGTRECGYVGGDGNVYIPYTNLGSGTRDCLAMNGLVGPLPIGHYTFNIQHWDEAVVVTPSIEVYLNGAFVQRFSNTVGGLQTFSVSYSNPTNCAFLLLEIRSPSTNYAGSNYAGGDRIYNINVTRP